MSAGSALPLPFYEALVFIIKLILKSCIDDALREEHNVNRTVNLKADFAAVFHKRFLLVMLAANLFLINKTMVC